MTPAKITPGPWVVDKAGAVRTMEGFFVAEVWGGGTGVVEKYPAVRADRAVRAARVEQQADKLIELMASAPVPGSDRKQKAVPNA